MEIGFIVLGIVAIVVLYLGGKFRGNYEDSKRRGSIEISKNSDDQ